MSRAADWARREQLISLLEHDRHSFLARVSGLTGPVADLLLDDGRSTLAWVFQRAGTDTRTRAVLVQALLLALKEERAVDEEMAERILLARSIVRGHYTEVPPLHELLPPEKTK